MSDPLSAQRKAMSLVHPVVYLLFFHVELDIGEISYFSGFEIPGFVLGILWMDSSRNQIHAELSLVHADASPAIHS